MFFRFGDDLAMRIRGPGTMGPAVPRVPSPHGRAIQIVVMSHELATNVRFLDRLSILN